MSPHETPTLTRRQTLGGCIALTTFGTVALATQPRTTAAIEVDALRVDDEEIRLTPSERVDSVRLIVEGSYDHTATHDLHRRRIDLQVDVNGVGYETLVTQLDRDDAVEREVEAQAFAMDANLLEHSGLSAGMFDVDVGQSVAATLGVRLVLTLIRNNTPVGEAVATDMARLVVTKEEVETTAALDGDGSFDVTKATVTPTASG